MNEFEQKIIDWLPKMSVDVRSTLMNKAAEINKARAFGQITEAEHTALLTMLVNENTILTAVADQKRKIIYDKLIDLLKLIPLKV